MDKKDKQIIALVISLLGSIAGHALQYAAYDAEKNQYEAEFQFSKNLLVTVHFMGEAQGG